jgi:hypothetical protein
LNESFGYFALFVRVSKKKLWRENFDCFIWKDPVDPEIFLRFKINGSFATSFKNVSVTFGIFFRATREIENKFKFIFEGI